MRLQYRTHRSRCHFQAPSRTWPAPPRLGRQPTVLHESGDPHRTPLQHCLARRSRLQPCPALISLVTVSGLSPDGQPQWQRRQWLRSLMKAPGKGAASGARCGGCQRTPGHLARRFPRGLRAGTTALPCGTMQMLYELYYCIQAEALNA